MADEEKEIIEEAAVPEELDRLRQEREALSLSLQARDARIKELEEELSARDARIKELEEELSARDADIASLKEDIAKLEGKLAGISENLAQAVAAYRELIAAANPEVPSELVTGETIEAIDASLENARALIDRVKQGIEAEASRIRIPAGAPQRAPLDLSALSSREKIQYAIGGRR